MTTTERLEKGTVRYLSALADQKREEINSIQLVIEMITRQAIDSYSFTDLARSFQQSEMEEPLQRKKRPLEPVNVFNTKGKLDHKIAYALTKVGRGFREDILEEIAGVQPSINLYRLRAAVAVRLTHLLQHSLIVGEKIGRRYEYQLISTQEPATE